MTNTVTYPSYTNTWVNSDGLPVRFGKGAQVDAVCGYAANFGDNIEYVYSINWDRLPAFGASAAVGQIYGGYPDLAIPAGFFLESAILITDKAFTGATATLTLGLVDKAGADMSMNSGLFSALAVASMTIGSINTGGGATIATTLAATAPAYYLWASVGTASFTAGQGRLIIKGHMPDTDKNNA